MTHSGKFSSSQLCESLTNCNLCLVTSLISPISGSESRRRKFRPQGLHSSVGLNISGLYSKSRTMKSEANQGLEMKR